MCEYSLPSILNTIVKFLTSDNYGGPHLPRQNLLFHGKTYFLTAKLTFSRQNLLSHGKTYFLTAKLTFPRQNLLSHGKTYFSTAKLTFPRQNLLFHGKTYFSTAKLTFSRQNLLFHGKTYFLPKIWNLERESGNGIRNTVKVVERLKLPRKAISSTIHLVRYS